MSSTVWSGNKTFTAAGGAQTLVPVPAPARGTLRGYSLVQTSGAENGFSATFYTSDKAPEDLYKLLSVTAAGASADAADLNIAYQNRNGTPSIHERLLYLRITPSGSGDKSFTLSITVENPNIR